MCAACSVQVHMWRHRRRFGRFPSGAKASLLSLLSSCQSRNTIRSLCVFSFLLICRFDTNCVHESSSFDLVDKASVVLASVLLPVTSENLHRMQTSPMTLSTSLAQLWYVFFHSCELDQIPDTSLDVMIELLSYV